MTTTVRVEEEQIVKTKGPFGDARENFRAFYLVESDDHASVLEIAARIPAARTGGRRRAMAAHGAVNGPRASVSPGRGGAPAHQLDDSERPRETRLLSLVTRSST
jgi:hypothetical protein